MVKELGLLAKDHPGIAVSVKSQQAARRVLNDIREKLNELREEGLLDEHQSLKGPGQSDEKAELMTRF